VPVPQVQPPLFLPEKSPPPLPGPARPLLRSQESRPGVARLSVDQVVAWDSVSAKR
jgi:hypothetical protein